MDHDGNVWHLRNTADCPTRYEAMYYPTVISKKQDLILVCMEAKNLKQVKVLDDAKAVLEMNKYCEHTIINLVKNGSQNLDNKSNADILSHATLEIFEKEKSLLSIKNLKELNMLDVYMNNIVAAKIC